MDRTLCARGICSRIRNRNRIFQTRGDNSRPDVATRSVRVSGFSSAAYVGTAISLTFFGLVFVLSLYFQEVRGYSPVTAGLAFMPLTALPSPRGRSRSDFNRHGRGCTGHDVRGVGQSRARSIRYCLGRPDHSPTGRWRRRHCSFRFSRRGRSGKHRKWRYSDLPVAFAALATRCHGDLVGT